MIEKREIVLHLHNLHVFLLLFYPSFVLLYFVYSLETYLKRRVPFGTLM